MRWPSPNRRLTAWSGPATGAQSSSSRPTSNDRHTRARLDTGILGAFYAAPSHQLPRRRSAARRYSTPRAGAARLIFYKGERASGHQHWESSRATSTATPYLPTLETSRRGPTMRHALAAATGSRGRDHARVTPPQTARPTSRRRPGNPWQARGSNGAVAAKVGGEGGGADRLPLRRDTPRAGSNAPSTEQEAPGLSGAPPATGLTISEA